MKKLSEMHGWYRNRDGALIAGVSSGLARGLNCSPWLIRMGWVLFALIAIKLALLAYLVAALLMPLARGSRSGKTSAPDRENGKPDDRPSPRNERIAKLEKEFRDLEGRLGRHGK